MRPPSLDPNDIVCLEFSPGQLIYTAYAIYAECYDTPIVGGLVCTEEERSQIGAHGIIDKDRPYRWFLQQRGAWRAVRKFVKEMER